MVFKLKINNSHEVFTLAEQLLHEISSISEMYFKVLNINVNGTFTVFFLYKRDRHYLRAYNISFVTKIFYLCILLKKIINPRVCHHSTIKV